MARYTVSALKAVSTPAGAVLDRIVGPGWMATPTSLMDLLMEGRHEFVLDGGDHRLAARRDKGADRIVVIDSQGREIAPVNLPHWQTEDNRAATLKQRRWWQRFIDPDAR